jgi:4,5-dihydroxyphthalate decarboxylase
MLAPTRFDCAIIARPPTCFLEGHPRRRAPLPEFPRDGRGILHAHEGLADHAHHRDAESIVDEHPWCAQPVQRVSRVEATLIERILDSSGVTLSRCRGSRPTRADARHVRTAICFPYGIEENRPTWEQMALYTYQQGIAHRHMKPEDFFPRPASCTKVVI